jgi:hypothetical protein
LEIYKFSCFVITDNWATKNSSIYLRLKTVICLG